MSVEAWDRKHIDVRRWVNDIGSPDDRILSHAIIRYGTKEQVTKAKILDLGCGEGTNAFWLGKIGYPITGVDYSTVGIQFARALCSGMPNVTFYHTDLRKKLPFPNESFNLIYDMRALECLDVTEIAAVVDEVKRVLTTRGIFLSITASPERYLELDVAGAPVTRLTREQISSIYECPEFHKLLVRECMNTDGMGRKVHDWLIRAEKKDKA